MIVSRDRERERSAGSEVDKQKVAFTYMLASRDSKMERSANSKQDEQAAAPPVENRERERE
jgi:hypothetical protein